MTFEEDSFLRGERAVYKEDDAAYIVNVLDNTSDRNNIEYELEVVKVIKRHPFMEDLEVGKIFECNKLRNVGCSGLWHLEQFMN